jgi:hypothetical protein
MGAFTGTTWIADLDIGSNSKTSLISAVAPASYDANGSILDLSEATLGSGHGFAVVYSVKNAGLPVAGTKANSSYRATYAPATDYAAATGKVAIDHLFQATPAEASGDLSTTPGTMLFIVVGR